MPNQTTERRKPLKIAIAVGKFLEEGIPSILLAVCVVLLCTDVVARYVFNSPIAGAGSIAMVCFIWVTFIGSAAIARRGRHIVIDVLVTLFPSRIQAIVQSLVQLFVIGVIGFVLYFTWNALLNTRFVAIPGLGVSRRVLAIALFIGFLLMAMYAVRDLISAVRGAITGDYAPYKDPDDEFDSLDASAPGPGGYEPPTSVTEAVYVKELDDILEREEEKQADGEEEEKRS